MAIDMMPLMDEAEPQRQAQIREQFVRSYRAQTRTRLRAKIFAKVRRTFIFLLGAAIVTFIVAYRNNINSAATQKTRQLVAHLQAKADSVDPLRQSAANYEKAIEEVASK